MLAVMGVMLGGKIQAQTGPAFSNIDPNGAWQFQSSSTLTFNVTSSVGVAPGSIVVQLTATNLLGQASSLSLSNANGLTVTGSANNSSVSAPLTSNIVYAVTIQATDANKITTTTNISFDTIKPAYTFEAEDFDYTNGNFINNPQTNKYAGLNATYGIDVRNTNFAGGGSAYRPSGLNTEVNGDRPRLAYSTGLQDYDVGWNNGGAGNWGNYTRTFPAGTYNIYMRGANPNGFSSDSASMSLVTSGRGTPSQITTNLGTFSVPTTGNWQAYTWIPLLDATGNPVRFTGGSTETLRVSTDNGSYNANFYMLMPADTNQPVIGNVYPDGSSFFQYTNVLSFTASCPAGITTNSISVILDGTSALGLIFTGSATNWNVSCPLATNMNHTVAITVTAENGNAASTTVSFNDFQATDYQIEAEDYDYTSNGVSGLFFDGLTGAYAGLGGMAHIDLLESDTNAFGRGYSYRAANGADFPDMASQDQARSQFTAAGKTDYAIGSFGTGSWANYTRHYPAGTYNVWGRFAEGQAASEVSLSLLTGGYGTTSQTASFLGTFSIPLSGWSTWEWGVLEDGSGNPVQVTLDGSQQTLQLGGSPINSQPEVNVNFLMLVPATTNQPVIRPLAAYYPLNGDVLDYSGNGLNGVNKGATFVSPGYTTGAEAAQFNGTSTSFVQIPRSVGVSGSGFTISLWVKTTQTAGSGPWYAGNGLVDGYLPGPQNAFGVSLDGTKFALGIGNPDTTLTSATTINDGNWHHVAATWNMTSGAMAVYVNGSLDSSGTGPTGPRTADSTLCIGRTPQNPNFFNGEIADVRLYSTVFTAQQIASLASLQPVVPSLITPTAYPTNVVFAGYTVTLNELSAGPPSPSYYQWMTNGVPIPGANSATLVLSNVTTAQSGNYAVMVGNSVGTNISPALAVTVNPASAPIFTMQPTPASQQVPVNGQTTITAAVDGSPPIALQWQFDGTNLPAQTQSSLVLSSVQTNESGSYTLVAANAFGTNTSQAATLAVVLPVSTAPVNVPTYHNDNQRSGANTNEVILTPNNVNTNTFGKLFTQTVDGAIYAEPLYVSGVNIPGNGTHNVVIVATQHGSVYAFDADSNEGTNASPLWHTSFINPAAGVTPITPADVNNCFNIPYEECIDDTPAIDLNAGVIYVEALTREVVSGVVTYYHRLHALNITTGAELSSSPVVIQGSVSGTGVGGNGSTIPFTPILHECRAGLLLQNGLVYLCYSSFGDIGNYHGWVFAYNAQTLQQIGIYCDTPNGSQGGIWQGGDGMTADESNNVFCVTGNGTFGTNYSSITQYNLGEGFLKFTGGSNSLTLTDYFTPYNNASLSSADLDIAAGGPMVLPDSVGSVAHPHLMMGTGKNGTMYILDRDNLGHFNAANDNQIVQELPGAVGVPWNYPVPAFFNDTIFYQGNGSGLQAFHISNATVNPTPVATSSVIFGAPGGTPSVSANGTNNAIVWALEIDDWASGGNATLHAYNESNLVEIYNSNMNPGRDAPGAALKWTVPTIANGKVYVGEDYGLSVYGNGIFVATPTISPDGGTFTNSQTVTFSDATPGAQMYYTLDGTTPTTNSILYTAPFLLTNNATVTTFAVAPGAVNSGLASATFVNTSAAGTGTGLTGQYWTNTTSTAFTNASFNTPPTLTRVDPTINFNWGTTPPSPNIGLSNYCVRWTGTVQPQFNETYTFYATADDGVRLFINGQPLINGWVVEAATTYTNSITLKAQQLYNIEMDYFQAGGGAVAELQWSSPSTPMAVVPQTQLYPYTNPPPAIALVSPTNNASYTATASVTFDATAAAQYNSIDHVSFYSGGSLIGSISNSPYVFTATGLVAGSYTFTAAATDGSGLSSTSAPVNATVNPGSGLPYGLTNRGISPAFYSMPGVYSGPLPAELSQTGVFTNTPNMSPASGLIPYAPNTPLWSDNAVKTRYMGVPYNGGAAVPGNQIGYAPTGSWSFPGGTVFVKTFSLNVNETNANVPLHRLETRLLVRDTNGAVYGVTYKWRPDNSDADLMSNSLSENILITNAVGVRTQSWYYPSPADCLTCHTPVANYVLGLSTRQLNGSFTYTNTGVTDNQLRVLNQLGLLNPAIDESTISNLDQMVSVTNVNAPLVTRVRSYIDANCAQCHQPGGPGPSFDARFDTPLANQNIINGAVIANLGVDNAHVVTPDDIWRSMLYQRANSLTAGVKMPPLARNLIDTNAMAVMTAWINSLPGIPALAPPTLVPNGGQFSGPVSVTVVPPDTNATIYYTLDGSLPTTNSLEYLGSILLTGSATVTANAFENSYTNSIAVSGLFTIVPIKFISTPAFSGGVLTVELSAVTNETYVLQASTNLVNWTSIATNTPVSTPFYLSDPNASNFPTRFYRAVLQP